MDFMGSISLFREHIALLGIVNFLLTSGIIPKTKRCGCGGMRAVKSKGKGRLPTHTCRNPECLRSTSIKAQTFFGGFKSSIEDVMAVAVGWLNRYPADVIAREVQLERHTVARIVSSLRELIFVWLQEESRQIGSPGHIVEIDESAFGRRKYNRGRMTRTKWVLGGIDRGTRETFLCYVDRRDASTLNEAIQKFVKKGSIIKTDMWRGYCGLGDLGYHHNVVNHSVNFVEPGEKSTHTQTIENVWSTMKRDIRRRIGRICVESFETHLVEYVWRSRHHTKGELYADFFRALTYFYPNQ